MTPAAKRQAVTHACEGHELSERRACAILGFDRSMVRYRSRRPDDMGVRSRIRELAAERRRFGYRRLHFLLKKEGLAMNQKRFRRLYREEGLQVRKRGGRKRALGGRAPLALPSGPNERWSLDFASDSFTNGRRFRVLAIVDNYTRESLALVADTSLSGARVARELDAVIAHRGKPKGCVSDNGTELTSMAILAWSKGTGVDWHYIAPGKPQQNAFVESFIGRLRESASTTRCSHRSPRLVLCSQPGETTIIEFGRIRRSPTRHRRSSAITIRPLPQRPARVKTLAQDSPSEWRKNGSQVTPFLTRTQNLFASSDQLRSAAEDTLGLWGRDQS